MRTQQEKSESLNLLKQLKLSINQFNAFGEDNYKKIDVISETISWNSTEEFIYRKYNSDATQDENPIFILAINTFEYMQGKRSIQDLILNINLKNQ